MNDTIRRCGLILSALFSLVLAGCAGFSPQATISKSEMTWGSVTPVGDGMALVRGHYCVPAVNLAAAEKAKLEKEPWLIEPNNLAHCVSGTWGATQPVLMPTMGRDIVASTIPSATVALIQANAARSVASKSCPGGSCGPVVNSTVNNKIYTCGAECGN